MEPRKTRVLICKIAGPPSDVSALCRDKAGEWATISRDRWPRLRHEPHASHPPTNPAAQTARGENGTFAAPLE